MPSKQAHDSRLVQPPSATALEPPCCRGTKPLFLDKKGFKAVGHESAWDVASLNVCASRTPSEAKDPLRYKVTTTKYQLASVSGPREEDNAWQK